MVHLISRSCVYGSKPGLNLTYRSLRRQGQRIYTYVYTKYNVPLREVAGEVYPERNEKHPAWNEYDYIGNSRTRIVLILTLIHKRKLHFRTGRYFFLPTWECTVRVRDKLFGATQCWLCCAVLCGGRFIKIGSQSYVLFCLRKNRN